MANGHEFTFRAGGGESGEVDGRSIVQDALVAQGFTLASTPTGGLLAQRGSTARTVLLGGLAGSRMAMRFVVDFFAAPDGQVVARLNRDTVGSVLKGGALGAMAATRAFEETANAIHAALASAGILTASTPV